VGIYTAFSLLKLKFFSTERKVETVTRFRRDLCLHRITKYTPDLFQQRSDGNLLDRYLKISKSMVMPILLLFQNYHKGVDFLPLPFLYPFDLGRKNNDVVGSNLMDI
jgi:hypothetical protein